jgi:hypothetical protein
MEGKKIAGMLNDVEGEPDSVKTIRALIRQVHGAFFGSDAGKSDDDKKELLLKLIKGYKLDSLSDEEKENYEFFNAASQQIAVFNTPLGGEGGISSTDDNDDDFVERMYKAQF